MYYFICYQYIVFSSKSWAIITNANYPDTISHLSKRLAKTRKFNSTLLLMKLWKNQHLYTSLEGIQGVYLVAQCVQDLPAMQETPVWFLGQQDTLEEGMATCASVFAPETEQPGGLHSQGWQRVGGSWSDWTHRLAHRRNANRITWMEENLKILSKIIYSFTLWFSNHPSWNLFQIYTGKYKRDIWSFPGGQEVKNLPASAGDMGLIPGLRRSHARGHLSLCTTATEPVLQSRDLKLTKHTVPRAHAVQQEKPLQWEVWTP